MLRAMLQTTARILVAVLAVTCLLTATARSSAAQSFRVTAVSLEADPPKEGAPCPVTIKFPGTIKAKGRGVVKYTFLRSDGATGRVHTLEFTAPGTRPVDTTWTLSPPYYEGWVVLKVLSPNEMLSDKASFTLKCPAQSTTDSLAPETRTGEIMPMVPPVNPEPTPKPTPNPTPTPPAPTPGGKTMPMVPPVNPDLMVAIKPATTTATAGTDIGSSLKVTAMNLPEPRGRRALRAAAPGTMQDFKGGYMIDLVLSTDMHVPEGLATFSPNFVEDVLLQGGRISNTPDLAAGASKALPAGAVIPADTPSGKYFLCARIDPGGTIAETDETNNVACVALWIKDKAPK